MLIKRSAPHPATHQTPTGGSRMVIKTKKTKSATKTKTGPGAKSGKKKKIQNKFVLDCSRPQEDGIFNSSDFEKYLHERIKVNGKTNNLGNNVTIERNKAKITVVSDIPFSKRYLKYLSKKYLKKNSLRDWLRVVSATKDSYELKYFQINNEDDEEDAS